VAVGAVEAATTMEARLSTAATGATAMGEVADEVVVTSTEVIEH
jgi:hypothetical protein